jgi:hypothetical protein
MTDGGGPLPLHAQTRQETKHKNSNISERKRREQQQNNRRGTKLRIAREIMKG